MTREEAIDCINAIHVQMFNSGNSKWTEACDMAIKALKDRPHGEWNQVEERADGRSVFMCSVCQRTIETFTTKPSPSYPYCHCGASMCNGALLKEGEAE